MADGAPQPDSKRLTWIGAVGLLLVVLLVLSNVLLWQLVDQGSDDDQKSPSTGASQPLLPNSPSSGTSNRAAAAELDRLSSGLQDELRGLRADLGPLPAGLSAFGSLPALTNNLDALAAAGRQLQGGTDSLRRVASSTKRLREVEAQLGRIRNSIGGVRTNTGSLTQSSDDASKKLTTSNAGIATTNQRLIEVSNELAKMSQTLAGTQTRIGSLDNRTGTTVQSLETMNQTLTATRADIQTLIKVLCQTSQQPPQACQLVGG